MSSPKNIKLYNYAMATGLALGSSGLAPADSQMVQATSGSAYSWGFETEYDDNFIRSGFPMSFFADDMQYRVALTQAISISPEERLRQQRYKDIERSFLKNSDGLPGNKMSYMEYMANVMCGLSFEENISAFNKFDETIDSVFRMRGDLTLSLTQFLDEDQDAPVVFSIHRGEDLLVSAEMKLDELAKTVNEVLISEAAANV